MRKSPWIWLLAAVGLLMLCAVLVAAGIGIATLSFFSTSVIESDTAEIVGKTAESLSALTVTFTSQAMVLEQASVTTLPGSTIESLTPVPTQGFQTPEPQLVEPSPSPVEEISPDTNFSLDEETTAGERARIESNVIDIRRLAPLTDVHPVLLSTSELGQRMEQEFAEEYSPEEARYDAIALSAFDLLAPDFDLFNFSIDLLTEQVAGFYDPETDEFVIISNDDEFTSLEQWTHAHEYVHALQDQHYNLEILEDDDLGSEASFAIQALAEGDATLVQTMFLFSGYFSQDQLAEIMEEALSVDTTMLDSAPPVVAHELEFPYISGLAFVQALYDRGGFSEVDKAWENPPQSTEHILHPERYLDGDTPQVVSLQPLTNTLGPGWVLADEDVLGEFYLREYLSQHLNQRDVDIAATGWGGDRYAIHWNESDKQVVMVLRLAWDSMADTIEFSNLFPSYPENALGSTEAVQVDGGFCWQGEYVLCLYDAGDDSLVIRAPGLDLAQSVASSQFP